MKKWIPLLCVALGVVLLIIGLVIPSASDKGGFIAMAKMLPEDVGEFYYFDVGELESDEDLQSVWTSVREYYLEDGIYGEDIGNITSFGVAGTESNISIYAGDLNLERMKSVIDQTSIESFDYEGITIWVDQQGQSTAVIDNTVFIGTSEVVRQCINTSKGQGASLYADSDVSDVISRLPAGYLLGVARIDDDDDAVKNYGLLGIGMAASKINGNVSQMSLLKFEDADALQDYLDMLESSISEDYDVVKDGKYLTVTMTLPIPSAEERAYSDAFNDVQNAVVVYATAHNGSLPTINATIDISGYEFKIVNICDLVTSEYGMLSEIPEGVSRLDGQDNDNCDSGCSGCLDTSHYIWLVDDYGYVYSTCVGANCSEYNADGFQGVWP